MYGSNDILNCQTSPATGMYVLTECASKHSHPCVSMLNFLYYVGHRALVSVIFIYSQGPRRLSSGASVLRWNRKRVMMDLRKYVRLKERSKSRQWEFEKYDKRQDGEENYRRRWRPCLKWSDSLKGVWETESERERVEQMETLCILSTYLMFICTVYHDRSHGKTFHTFDVRPSGHNNLSLSLSLLLVLSLNVSTTLSFLCLFSDNPPPCATLLFWQPSLFHAPSIYTLFTPAIVVISLFSHWIICI